VEHWYEGRYGPEWLHHMHKMIDALAEGHTLETYIQSVHSLGNFIFCD
jgi:hypothetical protein